MHHSRRLLLAAGALSIIACARAQQLPVSQSSILQSRADSIYLRLLDAITAQPIANAPVVLESSNGIVCIKAPCPTDSKQWTGTTDVYGRVTIPKNLLNTVANITSAEHHGDVINDASQDTGGDWIVELFSEETGDPGPRPLKLIDAVTNRPIANADVRIENRNVANVTAPVTVRSNALGWVLVPFEAMASGGDASWIVAPGFEAARIDFAYAQRRMKLKRK